jgi:hypothetical protein
MKGYNISKYQLDAAVNLVNKVSAYSIRLIIIV